MNVQERQAADEKIADLAASILAAERLDLRREPGSRGFACSVGSSAAFSKASQLY